MTPPPSLQICLRAVVDMLFPKSLIYRSILKLLYISFSVLHTWLQSVEILSVCTVAWDRASPDSSCITPPLQCPLCVTLSFCDPRHCLWPLCPSPQHAGPRALTRGSHDSRAICMRLAPRCRPSGSNAACHPLYRSEEGKLSTSQDACKDVGESPETAEAKSAAPRPPSSSPEQR